MLSLIKNIFPWSLGFKGLLVAVVLLSAACAPRPPQPSPGHLTKEEAAAAGSETTEIPPPVRQLPFVPPPRQHEPVELYSVVVDQIPIRELLFTLARDTGMNVDIHPGISGEVTLNAVDQTLEQILRRISEQVPLRYRREGSHIIIMPDTPYAQYYQIAYVNMSRETQNAINISTQVATTGVADIAGSGQGGGRGAGNGGNNSTTRISSVSNNQFWKNLVEGVQAVLGVDSDAPSDSQQKKVVAAPESGILGVFASSKQHREVQRFLDKVLANAQRQVLIEATIVEVQLSDHYQAGVDWQRISGDFSYAQNLLSGNFAGSGGYAFTYSNPSSTIGNIAAAVRLLEEFGTVRVLSSPKIMALNNQTAILKVVDNRVYFTVNVEVTDATSNSAGRTTFETEVHTVPEGLIINVTPQIAENNSVMLNIRPTISRIIGFVNDPNPALASVDIVSRVPEVQVREIESVLKVNSGNIAIIGGLMQDTEGRGNSSVPVLSDVPLVGDLFSYRNDRYTKTELAIFLRPVVITQASLQHDMKPYRVFLPDPHDPAAPPVTGLPLDPAHLRIK